MSLKDSEGNVTATGPVGPAGFRWTCLRQYGAGDLYFADLYRADGLDSLHFLEVGTPLPREAQDGTLDLSFNKAELNELITELTWLRDNWGRVGRDTN